MSEALTAGALRSVIMASAFHHHMPTQTLKLNTYNNTTQLETTKMDTPDDPTDSRDGKTRPYTHHQLIPSQVVQALIRKKMAEESDGFAVPSTECETYSASISDGEDAEEIDSGAAEADQGLVDEKNSTEETDTDSRKTEEDGEEETTTTVPTAILAETKSEDPTSRQYVYGAVLIAFLTRFEAKERKSLYRGIRNKMIHAYDSPNHQNHLHHATPILPRTRRSLVKRFTMDKIELAVSPMNTQENLWLTCSHIVMVADFLKEVCFVIESQAKQKSSSRKEKNIKSDLYKRVKDIWRVFKRALFKKHPTHDRHTDWMVQFTDCKVDAVPKLWKHINDEKARKQRSSSGYTDRISHFFESFRHGTIHFAGSDWIPELQTVDPRNNEMMVVMIYMSLFGAPLLTMMEEMITLIKTPDEGIPEYYRRIAQEEMFLVSDHEEVLRGYLSMAPGKIIPMIISFASTYRLFTETESFMKEQCLDEVAVIHTDVVSQTKTWRGASSSGETRAFQTRVGPKSRSRSHGQYGRYR